MKPFEDLSKAEQLQWVERINNLKKLGLGLLDESDEAAAKRLYEQSSR